MGTGESLSACFAGGAFRLGLSFIPTVRTCAGTGKGAWKGNGRFMIGASVIQINPGTGAALRSPNGLQQPVHSRLEPANASLKSSWPTSRWSGKSTA